VTRKETTLLRRILTAAAGLFALAALALPAAANAATPACTTTPAQDCGSQVNGYGYALTVTGRIGTNAYVTSVLDSAATGRSDFTADQTTANPDERTFELSPDGARSGWCAAQLTGWKRLVLRRCANTRWQQFTGVNTRDTSGTQWVNVNSHQTVQGEGAGNAFEAVTTVTNVKGSYFGFNAPGIAP